MPLAVLKKLIEDLNEKLTVKAGGDVLAREFLQLRMDSEDLLEAEGFDMSAGRLADNRRKNRYNDIVPFDYSRVKLSQDPQFYINSSYINGPTGKVAYIAAQGPLPSTVNDFWLMLIDQQIKIVVMLCNLVESGKAKCAQYWPTDVGATVTFGDVSVTLESEDSPDLGFIRRILVVTAGQAVRRIYQFHYTEWPDHGEPEGVDHLISLVEMINQCQGRDVQPVVVHCSAGCGRTGTICALHYCDVMITNDTIPEDFSVFAVVSLMRKQRVAMVQNVLQYKILHQGVLEIMQRMLTTYHEYSAILPVSDNVLPSSDYAETVSPEVKEYSDGARTETVINSAYPNVRRRPTFEPDGLITERSSLPQPLSNQPNAQPSFRRNSDSFDKPVQFESFAGHQIPTIPYHLDVKPIGPVEPPEYWERF